MSKKNTKKKLFFLHIPKTAGTSVKKILYDYKYDYSEKEIKKNKKIFCSSNKSLQPFTPYHIPYTFYKKDLQIKLKKKYILFAIVRNPYERIISDYKFWVNLLASDDKHFKYFFKTILKEEKLKKCLENVSKENLNYFIHFTLGDYYHLNQFDGHFIPMHFYTHIKKKDKYIQVCDHILHFETLNDDFNSLIQRLKLKIPLDIMKKTKENKTEDIFSVNDLDDISLYLIKKHYYQDFILFHYYPHF